MKGMGCIWKGAGVPIRGGGVLGRERGVPIREGCVPGRVVYLLGWGCVITRELASTGIITRTRHISIPEQFRNEAG